MKQAPDSAVNSLLWDVRSAKAQIGSEKQLDTSVKATLPAENPRGASHQAGRNID